jgi:hypothetical protein
VDDPSLAEKVFSEFEDARQLVNRFTGRTQQGIAECDGFKRVSACLDLEVQREAGTGVHTDEAAAGYACSVANGAPSVVLMDDRGGVTSDWLCMGREGALGPAINIVASLCLCRCVLLWLGQANGSPGCWISVSARR